MVMRGSPSRGLGLWAGGTVMFEHAIRIRTRVRTVRCQERGLTVHASPRIAGLEIRYPARVQPGERVEAIRRCSDRLAASWDEAEFLLGAFGIATDRFGPGAVMGDDEKVRFIRTQLTYPDGSIDD